MICDENEAINEKIQLLKRNKAKQIPQNHLKIATKDIEDSLASHFRDINDIETRVNKQVKKFESIPAVTKLQIRDNEVLELERKLS